jgi:hypothetical protein
VLRKVAVIGDGRLLDFVEKPLKGPSFSMSSWFNPPSSSSSIADKLDDEDEGDMAYSIEEIFSTEGERQIDDEKLKLVIQTKMIDTARRGRYMFK